MSNIGLYKAFDELGIDYVKTAVGDKYVHAEMEENGYELGGEQSGHIIYKKFANTGDGILTSLKIMEAMIEAKTDLNALTRDLKIYPQELVNVKVKSKEECLENKEVLGKISEIENKLGDSGRVLVRASGTEPLVRVMVEAETDDLAKSCVDEIVKQINSSGLAL